MHIHHLCFEAHEISKSKGFYETPPSIPERIALMHSELSEALESYREGQPLYFYGEKGKPEGLVAELADAVIRIADICGHLGVDLEQAIQEKMAYNRTRPYKHGGKLL